MSHLFNLLIILVLFSLTEVEAGQYCTKPDTCSAVATYALLKALSVGVQPADIRSFYARLNRESSLADIQNFLIKSGVKQYQPVRISEEELIKIGSPFICQLKVKANGREAMHFSAVIRCDSDERFWLVDPTVNYKTFAIINKSDFGKMFTGYALIDVNHETGSL
jgi:hypothetical protein